MDKSTMKTALSGAIGIAVVLIGIAAIWYAASYARSLTPEGGWNTLNVSASGKATAVPDVAQVSFSVTAEGGTDAAAIQTEANKKMDAVTAFLTEQGVAKDDITTTGYNVSPRYQYSACTSGICPPPRIVGYTVTQSVTVKIRDLSKAGTILAGAVSKGANGASGPTFVVDDPTKVENEARAQAIEKAQAKAKAIADASGLRLGKLLNVSDDTGSQPYPYYAEGKGGAAMDMMSVAPQAAPTISPGSQETTVTVSLTYSLR